MAQRSRRQAVPFIRNLIPSPGKPGHFELSWDGITYIMPLALSLRLADYFRQVREEDASVAVWHAGLGEEERRQILVRPSNGA